MTGMNVFVIPSWYPHRCTPLQGIYVRDQALALGELRPEWGVALSLWGQGRGKISAAHLMQSARCIIESLEDWRASEEKLAGNVVAFHEPTLTWTDRFLAGNRSGLLQANRKNLRRAIDRLGRIDILHAHVSYPAGWIAMHLARETGLPYVITEHMGPFPLPIYERSDGSLAPHLRRPLAEADARIAVGPSLADRIAAFGIPRPEVVPNLIDERLYRVLPKAPGTGFAFYTVCGMEPGKGIHDLLEAARLFLDRLTEDEREQVRFRLAGEGSALADLKRAASRLGLDRWVTWLGLVSRDVSRQEFEACDCFVLPSHHESFGIVFIEAMACGKPSIATRCGGPEYILTPETGVLVEIGDRTQLVESMLSIFRDRGRFDPMRIRASFEERFSRAATVDRLESIYRDVLARRAAPAQKSA